MGVVLVIDEVNNECDWIVVGGLSEVIGSMEVYFVQGKRFWKKGRKKA